MAVQGDRIILTCFWVVNSSSIDNRESKHNVALTTSRLLRYVLHIHVIQSVLHVIMAGPFLFHPLLWTQLFFFNFNFTSNFFI